LPDAGDAAPRRLAEHLPGVVIGDGLGSSQPGHLGRRAEGAPSNSPRVQWALTDDLSRDLRPGEDAVGWLCTGVRHARGYLDEKEKTEGTFVDVGGRSLVVSGTGSAAAASRGRTTTSPVQ
jgi:hypothetical protein